MKVAWKWREGEGWQPERLVRPTGVKMQARGRGRVRPVLGCRGEAGGAGCSAQGLELSHLRGSGLLAINLWPRTHWGV